MTRDVSDPAQRWQCVRRCERERARKRERWERERTQMYLSPSWYITWWNKRLFFYGFCFFRSSPNLFSESSLSRFAKFEMEKRKKSRWTFARKLGIGDTDDDDDDDSARSNAIQPLRFNNRKKITPKTSSEQNQIQKRNLKLGTRNETESINFKMKEKLA